MMTKLKLHIVGGAAKVSPEPSEGLLHVSFKEGDVEVKVTFHPALAMALAAEILEKAPRAGKMSAAVTDGMKRRLGPVAGLVAAVNRQLTKDTLSARGRFDDFEDNAQTAARRKKKDRQ